MKAVHSVFFMTIPSYTEKYFLKHSLLFPTLYRQMPLVRHVFLKIFPRDESYIDVLTCFDMICSSFVYLTKKCQC
jgi:hypothetical protein